MSEAAPVLLSEMRGHILILSIGRPGRMNALSPERSDAAKETLKKSFTIRLRYDSLALTERIGQDAVQFR